MTKNDTTNNSKFTKILSLNLWGVLFFLIYLQYFKYVLKYILFIGKSTFLMKLIEHRKFLFTTHFARVMYCVPAHNAHLHEEFFNKLKEMCPEIELILGLPKPNQINSDTLPKLLLIDDLVKQLLSDPFMEQCFVQNSHHQGCSIAFCTQNFYESSKSKTIVRQCNFKVFFNSNCDKILLRNIGAQIEPSRPSILIEAFKLLQKHNPSDKYKYLLIDGDSQSAMPDFFIRTNIFPVNDIIRPICFVLNSP